MNNFEEDLGDLIPNRENIDPVSMDFEPIPAGHYKAHIVETEVKDTKSGNGGKILLVTWELLEGNHKGRRLLGNFNIINPSADAERIGQGQLSALSKALGYPCIPPKRAKLLNRPHLIKVTLDNSNPAYPNKNVVKNWYHLADGGQKAAAKTAPKESPAPVADDDIPDFVG